MATRRSALRVLRCLAGLLEAVLLALLATRVASEQAGLLQRGAGLGIELDEEANARRATRISTAKSRVSAWVVPTNEELMIARHTGRLLALAEPRGQTARQGA